MPILTKNRKREDTMKLRSIVIALGLAMAAGGAQAQSIDLTLSGGNPGGLWSLLGAGLDRAAKAENPDNVITYQATGGGFANIGLLATNRSDLGLVHDAEVKLALTGQEPFKAPVTNLQAIGYMYNWAPMHFFLKKSVADEYGIDSLDDLASSGAPLTIGINRSGNITGDVALFMLEAAGLDEATLEANGGSFVRAGANEQGDLMQDGRITMATNGIFIGHSSFRAIDENTDVVLLEIPEDVIAATNEQFGTSSYTIPAGSYSKQTGDIDTMALGAMVVATDAMDEAVAETLARSVLEHIDEIRGVHGAMKQLSPELMVSQTVLPFHPGAAKVYKEAGLIE
ncbi:TAXI family TRAP transporter solute-binding subunit [Microbaculum marinisediminis]|uniref:TAXI family TRAP transporter solute-binding subunit n=1 Tax=Microbaculum marinisediminis TaxID=2931392 RepID=A0AAW5R5S9_9HYPH|nr:TAXI family TRAP transporter solute-binding subunit [Microbaculum sp. A6E488]MCT8973984.1 TAXI family TRAP transporter solute-binding subunit [Microbaculum sp. A6E488]